MLADLGSGGWDWQSPAVSEGRTCCSCSNTQSLSGKRTAVCESETAGNGRPQQRFNEGSSTACGRDQGDSNARLSTLKYRMSG